ncbi:zinc finger FYVE domain-containing protein 26 isoform X2 [Rhinoderma darwinii]|uniref:zinc finger FYVE domain-containing protein 26 isoform X2 n=1 Tax=Rhinoderma darwinii TaxID=43563 RepID=UPI003F676E76
MSRLPPPFGEEEEAASLNSLREFFCRCLRKGHWELARACLPQLSRGPDAGEVEEILRGLVRAPHLLRCDDDHTPQKLAWFWLNALDVWLVWTDKLPPDILKDETEFLFLLEEFQSEASEQTELYDAYLYGHAELKENRKEIPSPRFSEATVSSLRGFLSQNPRLVQSLIGFLLVADAHPASSEYNHYLLNITVNFLLDLLSTLQEEDEADAVSRTSRQIYGVLSTMHFNVELQAGELRHLCELLFNVCSHRGLPSEDRVQACLMRKQNYGLVSLYGTVSNEKIKAHITTRKSPAKGAAQELCDPERAVLTLFYAPEQARPWKEIYFYSLSTGKHFLEQILLSALALLKKEDFSSLDGLLSNELKPLRRLLVLLGWTHLQSTESARSLLNIMHKNMDFCNDSLLTEFCDGLLYQVEALEWCIEHSRQEISRKDILRHLCTLDSHSALYILHHLTNLPQLNEDEVLKLLRRGLSEEVTTEHHDLLEKTQHRNIVVFQAFCAMKYAIYALCVNAPDLAQCRDYYTNQLSSSLDDSEYGRSSEYPNLFVQYLSKCQYYLCSLPLPLKLELLENIFSLMFISVADLRSDPPLPEGCAMEEGDEDVELKLGRLGSMDCSTERGESTPIMSPMESSQHSNSSLIITDLNSTSQGSTPCALDISQNNLWDLVRCNYVDLKHVTSRLGGFLVDEVVLDTFLKMLKEQVDLIKDSIHLNDHDHGDERKLFISASEDFRDRVIQLSKYISEAQWRYKVVMSNRNAEYELVSARLQLRTYKTSSTKRRRRAKGSGSRKPHESTSSELSTSESSASNLSARTDMGGSSYLQQRNNLIPMMLSPPESLLVSCILRGNYTDAHEVSRMFNLQSSPSHGELIFMERYQEVIRELSKVEKKIENQTSEVAIKKLGSSRSTLQAIGNAAAAGMVFYSISDVTDKLVAPAECLVPALQDDFWLRSARLEKTDRWRQAVDEMNPAAMAAFDLACTQAHMWKTCKQLLETAERRLQKCLETKGRTADVIIEHPEGIRGVQAVLQQMSKVINYPSPPQAQTEIEEKISSQLRCSITELLHSCYSFIRDEHMVRHITLSHELEKSTAQLKSAIASHEPKGSLIQSLMDQLSMKPQDVQSHPVRKQMTLLMNNLEELTQLLDNRGLNFSSVHCFFTYIDTFSKVIIQSINSDSETSTEVKVANPFVLLHQKPSQVVSHLLFERQVPPERLSSLLKKENLSLNVEQVIADYCCSDLSFCNVRKVNQAQSLSVSLVLSAQQSVDASLPAMDIAMSIHPQDSEDTALGKPYSPSSDSSQYSLTPSALNFLKAKSTLTAAVACLSATKSLKPAKSGLSWMELRGSKKESPLEMDNIAKECDLLLAEFPVLQRFITLMSAPFRDGSQELGELSSHLCGKPCAASALIGLHASSASAVISEAFQDALSKKNWTSALQLLDLYVGDSNIEQVRDALLCCAAAEEIEGWRYLFAVRDATLRSKLALRFLDKWPLDACREILSYCVYETDIGEILKLELQTKRKELEVYRKILSLQEDATWTSWQDLMEDCTKDPQAIITIILEAKDYLLCEDWGLFYPIPMDLLINLYREHLLHLLGEQDTERSLQLLKGVEDQNLRLAVTEQALLQNPGISASQFLSEYLLAHFSSSLLEMRCNDIRNIFLGSKVLLALPECAHSNYEHLISSPLLMLEQLLMNMKIEWVSVAVQTLQQLVIEPDFTFSIEDVDILLCTYAGKALEIPFSFREKRTDSVSRIPESSSQSADPEQVTSSCPADQTNSPFVDRSRLQSPAGLPEKGHRRNKSSPEFVPPDKPPAKTQWIPDETEVTCMVCKNERFTMFNRRHHCRRCGRLVCSSCSMKKMVVEGCRENPARVCDQCHNYFFADIHKREEDFEQLEEKSGGNLDLSEVLRLSKVAELQWWLTLNEAENEVERSEFYYDQAPSASLCSAILNLHSQSDECGFQLIERCCLLSKGLTNPEMDSRLLLDIMKKLLFSAKMIFVKAARSHDLALCDSYSSKVDLLKILVAASYQDIPSLDEIVRPAAVVRLRNRLLEAEYYNLAIEVSTKTGLDPSGVWHAWGIACLKSDNLPGAREKFCRCMKVPLDLNLKNIGSKLLEDVVQHLESAAKPILLVKDDEYFATLKELEVTLKARCLWYEMMPEGKIQNNTYYQECLYYLHTYGTHLGIIQFYMRHDLMRDALLHLLNKECPGDIFIEGIFVPSYESGKLQMLETMLESIDSTLESWSIYLIDACKHLQQKNYFNILYELQQFMKDHVRAAMTCIRFFSHKAKSYRDLGNNQTWLVKSKEHLKISLQEVSRSNRRKSFDTFRKKMSATDVSRHINTVELQMEITKFLQRCESLQTGQVYDNPPPTLFGHSAMMIDVACRVILGGKNVEEGFGIAFRVIQDFQLDAFKVYSKVCKQLVQEENYSEILQLVKCVSESGVAAEKDCDQILLRCVEEMADVSSDELEKLIQGMRSDETKIKAFLVCHMMRSAYLTAVKQEHERAIQLVQEVWQAAHNLKDSVVQGICSKWLVEHPPVSKQAQRHTSRK